MGNWDYQIKVGGYLDTFRDSGLDDSTDEGVAALQEVARKVAEGVRTLPHWYDDAEFEALDPSTDRVERAEAALLRNIVKHLLAAETLDDFNWAYAQLGLWGDDERVLLAD